MYGLTRDNGDSTTMKGLAYKHVLIQMNDPNDVTTTQQLLIDLENANPYNWRLHYRNELEDSLKTASILSLVNIIFDVIIVIVMFLCFFALSANMAANLYE
jgi:hypothetical protein